MQSGTGQAARSWRPILSFEVEEDTGIRLCWSHSCFHRNSPHIPRDRLPVGLGDPRRDHLEKNKDVQLEGQVERQITDSQVWEGGMSGFSSRHDRVFGASVFLCREWEKLTEAISLSP